MSRFLWFTVYMCFHCSEEKAKLLRRITTKIEEKNQELRYVCCMLFSSAFMLRLRSSV